MTGGGFGEKFEVGLEPFLLDFEPLHRFKCANVVFHECEQGGVGVVVGPVGRGVKSERAEHRQRLAAPFSIPGFSGGSAGEQDAIPIQLPQADIGLDVVPFRVGC